MGREVAKVGPDVLAFRSEGIELSGAEEPPVAAAPDYPSVLEDRFRAAAALGRLAAMRKIHWRDVGSYPPALRVCLSHLALRRDKVRVVRDWPNALRPLNSVLVNPPVQYGTLGVFLRMLTPGAYVRGVDLQDCFLHWLVAPSRRSYLGVRHPMSGVLGVYLFLPVGLGRPPGWYDKCVEAVLGAARARFPELYVVDFVGDIRFVGASGEHDALAVGITGFTPPLEQMGVRYHAKEGKGWWPTAPYHGWDLR